MVMMPRKVGSAVAAAAVVLAAHCLPRSAHAAVIAGVNKLKWGSPEAPGLVNNQGLRILRRSQPMLSENIVTTVQRVRLGEESFVTHGFIAASMREAGVDILDSNPATLVSERTGIARFFQAGSTVPPNASFFHRDNAALEVPVTFSLVERNFTTTRLSSSSPDTSLGVYRFDFGAEVRLSARDWWMMLLPELEQTGSNERLMAVGLSRAPLQFTGSPSDRDLIFDNSAPLPIQFVQNPRTGAAIDLFATPVPEPTRALLGGAVLASACMSRRRRKSERAD